MTAYLLPGNILGPLLGQQLLVSLNSKTLKTGLGVMFLAFAMLRIYPEFKASALGQRAIAWLRNRCVFLSAACACVWAD
jgi:putative Ca2+/H+ antiporter (TMEM165/GDT1 family)